MMMMMMMETASSLTPLLFRNHVTSLFILAENSISSLAQKHKALELIRYVFVSSFLFFLRLLLSALHPTNNELYDYKTPPSCNKGVTSSRTKYNSIPAADGGSDTAIARALSQLLSIANDIPVSSRKYQVVRSLAENIIHDNQREGVESLRQVNRTVLSEVFSRTLSRLEATANLEQQGGATTAVVNLDYWVVRAVRSVADVVWTKGVVNTGGGASRSSAEKLAAELLWLSETVAGCGFAQEAVRRWASASSLARLSLSAEPRLQASLLKISALLLKYSKDMGMDESDDENTIEQPQREQAKMQVQMLVLWIPLLCIGSNGTDVPVLSMGERTELERVLEETIEKLEEEDQERVLSLWLHHFTFCPSSDWPNLNAAYARWCNASRKQLIVNS